MKRFMCHLLAIPVWVAVAAAVNAIIPEASPTQRTGVIVTVIVGYYLAGLVRDFFVEILDGEVSGIRAPGPKLQQVAKIHRVEPEKR